MAISRRVKSQAYGVGQPLIFMPPSPIISSRSPTISDLALTGTAWVNKVDKCCYLLSSVISNKAYWMPITVNEGAKILHGNVTVDDGSVYVPAGNVEVGLDISARTFFARGDHGIGKIGETALTNVIDTGGSTGSLRIKSKTNKSANNDGFFMMYIGENKVWVPYFSDISPT